MQKLFKKKYQYQLSNDKYNYSGKDDSIFLFSPLPLSESLHIGQLHTLVNQDTLRRLLEKNNVISYTIGYPFTFSPLIYKSIGNQTLKTEKILKQKKQNKNKLKQFALPGIEDALNNDLDIPLSEKNLVYSYKIFEHLYAQNLITIKKNITYRDSNLRMELNDKDYTTKKNEQYRYEIKFFIDGKGNAVSVFTYDPHTIFSTVAIAVHPKDRRFKKFIGKHVLIPIINKKIPIITDEDINMIQDQGAQAINPGHDKNSLFLAKKHNLPTDIYSINEAGKFTNICGRFSGKEVKKFKENVTKFMEDIGNLSKGQKEIIDTKYTCYTDSVPHLISKEQIYLTKNIINFDTAVEDNNEIDTDKDNNSQFLISSYAKGGSLFPILWDKEKQNNYLFLAEKFLGENITVSKILTLLVISLTLEGRLPNLFTLEKCIQLLLEPSYENGIPKYESYLASYELYYSSNKKIFNTIKKILKEVNENIAIEKFIEIIEDCPYLEKNNISYSLSRKKILEINEDVSLNNHLFFHQNFLTATSYLNYLLINQKTKHRLICHDQDIELLSYIKELLGIPVEITYRGFTPLYNKDGELFSFQNSKIIYTQLQEIQKKYGPDVTRILLLKSGGNFEDLSSDASYLGRLIQKIWNICRIVFKNDTTTSLNTTFPILKENINVCNEFDLWILDKTNEYLSNVKEFTQQEKFSNSIQKMEEYILFYLDHYIEIQKYVQSSQSDNILKYCLIFILQEIDIYFPILCRQISEIIPYHKIKFEIIPVTVLEYKANLFNDIITKIKALKLQENCMKHETIDCGVQCGPDMLIFLEEYGEILKSMLNINILSPFEEKQQLGSGYHYDTIIDMTVGIKKIEGNETKKLAQQSLQKQIEEFEDEIQRKKILLGRIIPIGDIKNINSKKEEIKILKEKLEYLKIKQSQ